MKYLCVNITYTCEWGFFWELWDRSNDYNAPEREIYDELQIVCSFQQLQGCCLSQLYHGCKAAGFQGYHKAEVVGQIKAP